MEFFGYGLCERGADVLADFRLAGIDGDGSGLGDVQPCCDVLREGSGTTATAGFLGVQFGLDGEQDYEAAAEELKEIAAVWLKAVGMAGVEFVAFDFEV